MSKRDRGKTAQGATGPTPLLEARGVTKDYRSGRSTLRVLHGIDLRIDAADLLLIVGPSGSGKSTLLHILGLLDRPTEGTVLLRGDDLYAQSGPRQARTRNGTFGFVFQFFHLLPDFTALENVLMPAVIQGARRQERGMQLLDQVGLADRATHRPSELSGGERQRVAIARALVNEPEVLFMDEPTGNLDSATAAQINDLVWQLNAETKQTVVMVTHNQELSSRPGRGIHIRDGRIDGRG